MSNAIEFLRDLAQKLQTQDNAYTASPNYCIQEHVQIVGIDLDYANSIGWFSDEDGEMASEEEGNLLEAEYDASGEEREGWTRAGYDWKWQYTGVSFMTMAAAQAYIDGNSHRHSNQLRVYVDSHYRNREMREVRRLLAGPLVNCIELLKEARESLAEGLETPGTLELPGSIADRTLVQNIDIALFALDTAKEPHQ